MSDILGTHPEYLIPTAIPRQQRLRERVTVLNYVYNVSII